MAGLGYERVSSRSLSSWVWSRALLVLHVLLSGTLERFTWNHCFMLIFRFCSWTMLLVWHQSHTCLRTVLWVWITREMFQDSEGKGKLQSHSCAGRFIFQFQASMRMKVQQGPSFIRIFSSNFQPRVRSNPCLLFPCRHQNLRPQGGRTNRLHELPLTAFPADSQSHLLFCSWERSLTFF